MKKIICVLICIFSFIANASSSDSINLSANVDFACEVEWNAEPVASNLDITTSQSHLYIGRFILHANSEANLNYDLPNEEKLVHGSVPTSFFSFDSVDWAVDGLSGNGNFPISGNYPMPGGPANFWEDFYLNYTGVPALSLVQGTYSATWYGSCGPLI